MLASARREMMPNSSVKKYYRIDRRELHYVKFILEGYAGAAVMSTLDPRQGLVALYVGPGCEDEVDMIINDLQKDIRIEAAKIRDKEA